MKPSGFKLKREYLSQRTSGLLIGWARGPGQRSLWLVLTLAARAAALLSRPTAMTNSSKLSKLPRQPTGGAARLEGP